MPRVERIANADACGLVRRWRIHPTVARMLVDVEEELTRDFSAQGLRWPGLTIISGFRSRSRQLEINPDVPTSLHTKCPALAVDLRVGSVPASATPFELWSVVGQAWKKRGGTWGGTFRDPDPNHFSLPDVPR